MPVKKKTESSTHSHAALEAQVKSLSADVNSLSLSVANLERQLAQLTTVDDLTETPPIPEGLEARFDNLVAVLSTKFGGIKGL